MKKIIFPLILVMLLAACHKDIEIFNPKKFKPKLVVFAYAKADSTLNIILGKTQIPGYLDSSDFISNAQISLLNNSQTVATFTPSLYQIPENKGIELHTIPYFYSNFKLSPEQAYTLKISYNNQIYSAQTFIPSKISANASIADFSTTNNNNIIYKKSKLLIPKSGTFTCFLNIYFNDPPSQNDYYLVSVYFKNYYLASDSLNPDSLIQFLDFPRIKLITTYNSPSDFFITPYPFDFNNVLSNRSVLVFSDYNINNKKVHLQLRLSSNFISLTDTLKFHIFIAHLSYDMFLFLKKYYLYSQNQTLSSMGLVEPVNLYSNIPNAYGVFAGLSFTKLPTISVKIP